MIRAWSISAALVLAAAACGSGTSEPVPPGGPGEVPAQTCPSYSATRSVFFGDLHVHTSYSSDAYAWNARLTPDDAYSFARGRSVALSGTVTHQLGRPLDFAAVTDHSELLSHAAGTRRGAWEREQQAAALALDAANCSFTSFVAYEWTGGYWQHRNVIFRNQHVPRIPISSADVHTAEALWGSLRKQCLEARTGCDVLAIPHNTNLSAGLTFRLEPGMDAADAALRSRMEPLVEMYQAKGNSECKRGVDTDDPLCNFELLGRSACDGSNAGHCTPVCSGTAVHGCEAPLSYVRNALKKGLLVEEETGENPLRLGIIASTDTHSGTPGSTEESNFKGAHGNLELDPRDRLIPERRFGAGGLAAVWSEENSRESLFLALRRRETYGTSGTRPAVRFFGGFALPQGLCGRHDLVAVGYHAGVPMGGALSGRTGAGRRPRFVVWAQRDPGEPGRTGTQLQRIQIIKGWVDRATGKAMEKVFEVAGSPQNGASVDVATCTRSGPGHDELCGELDDPRFDQQERAFYYARVIENPSCRHTAYDCLSLPPANRPAACQNPSLLTLQEQAWTSPIWYVPGNGPTGERGGPQKQ